MSSSNTSTSGNNNSAPPDAPHMRAEHSTMTTIATSSPTAATITTISSGSRQSSPNNTNTMDVVDSAATPPSSNNNNNNNTNQISRRVSDSSPSQPKPEVRYGKCKWFNVAKGWGFITPNDGGVEVFVHQSVIQMNGFRSLAEQEDVEFESEVTPRGVEATRVAGREGFDCVGSNFRPRLHGNRFVRRVRCYNCNKFNHIAADCRLEPQPRRCYLCQQEDHLIANCPRNTTQTSIDNSGDSQAPAEDGDLSST